MLVSFVLSTWLLAMVPGVGQALMLRQTLTGGAVAAVATILGTATGLVMWSAAAAVGLSAALLAAPGVYRALLVAGGMGLAAIGLRTLVTSGRGTDQSSLALAAPGSARCGKAYLAGLVTNLSNPKAGVFAISMLPAFAGVGKPLPMMLLGLLWATVTACWYLTFVLLVFRGRSLIARPDTQKTLEVVSGVVLILLGIAVALGI